MNQQPTYNPLELLRRWVRGDTPLEEERQLEQLAEDDPFLAEALEGYRRHPEGRHTEWLEQLKGRLRERSRKRKGMLFYLPRVAAAAVVLALAAGGLWLINGQGAGQPELAFEEKATAGTEQQAVQPAMVEDEAKGAGPQEAETAVSADASRNLLPPVPPKKGRSEEPGQPAGREPDVYQDRARAAEAAGEIAGAEQLPAPPEAKKADVTAEGAGPGLISKEVAATTEEKDKEGATITAKAKPAAPALKSDAPAPAGRKLRGYVFDADGEPLIGASVILKGTNQGSVTSVDGSFSLEIPEGAAGELLFTYTGYVTQELAVGQEDSLEVVLYENALALDEVVVTGFGARQKETPPPPRPEGGFNQMRQYIRQNLKYPAEARARNIEGKVKLEFRIQPGGRPGNVHVKQGLGYGCDEEAIRLLLEGPRWEGAGQQASYTVRFKL